MVSCVLSSCLLLAWGLEWEKRNIDTAIASQQQPKYGCVIDTVLAIQKSPIIQNLTIWTFMNKLTLSLTDQAQLTIFLTTSLLCLYFLPHYILN